MFEPPSYLLPEDDAFVMASFVRRPSSSIIELKYESKMETL